MNRLRFASCPIFLPIQLNRNLLELIVEWNLGWLSIGIVVLIQLKSKLCPSEKFLSLLDFLDKTCYLC